MERDPDKRIGELSVIGANDFYDTLVDDRIVARKTLHGQYIEQIRKAGKLKQLESTIEQDALLNKPEHYQCVPGRQAGRKVRYVFRDLKKSLREIIAEEKGMVTLDSQFKSIDIRDISDNYRFIGGKEQCAEFIKKSLAFMPQERCVNKTIQRTYRREDIPDAVFTKSHRDVEY